MMTTSDLFYSSKETDANTLIDEFLVKILKEEFPELKCLVIGSNSQYNDEGAYRCDLFITCLDSNFQNLKSAENRANFLIEEIRIKSFDYDYDQFGYACMNEFGSSISSKKFIFD